MMLMRLPLLVHNYIGFRVHVAELADSLHEVRRRRRDGHAGMRHTVAGTDLFLPE